MKMNRRVKTYLNIGSSLLYQIVALLCGFVLPKLLITYFGSKVSGLISSIGQFLAIISLCEGGVGAVVQAAFYKPLAEENLEGVSIIVKASNKFFSKIILVLTFYSIGLASIFPLFIKNDFDYFYTFSLILIVAFGLFAQYYFGITSRLLLNADQYGFVQSFIHSAILILNVVTCSIMILGEFSVHTIKLVSSLIFLVQPVVLILISNRKYKINKKIVLLEDPIKQKKNGVFHHISNFILDNTDVMVLTFFSTLENVSVYSVYMLIINGLKQIIVSLSSGVKAMFGNIIAKNESNLNSDFSLFEFVIHNLSVFCFTSAGLLIIPFVKIYTQGVTDADYIQMPFAIIMTAAIFTYCLRLPYNIVVSAAGNFKETQTGAIIESVVNVLVSIIFVFKFGLVGVAVGTLVAMSFRTLYLVFFLKNHILFRSIKYFFKNVVVDFICCFIVLVIVLPNKDWFLSCEMDYFSWAFSAIKVSSLCLVVVLIVNLVLNYKLVKRLYNKVLRKS